MSRTRKLVRKALHLAGLERVRAVPPLPSARINSFAKLPGAAGKCPICQEMTVSHVSPYPSDQAPFRVWVVYYCNSCGSGHVPNGTALIGDYYKTDYATQNRGDRDRDPAAYFAKGAGKSSRYATRAQSQLKALRKHGAQFDRVLDYGSGPGYLLHHSGAQDLHAVELDEMSFKYLDYLGATRHAPDALPKSHFDVIVASHVVEHFGDADVVDLVSGMVAALRPAGRLLVEVPNAAISRWVLPNQHAPHTLFFTNEGLRSLMLRCGAELVTTFLRSKHTYVAQPNPVYKPDPADAFASDSGGGITVIVTRS